MTSADGSSVARTAYQTLEPYHLTAYFNPRLQAAQQDTGLKAHAFYVGARGAPLGECTAGVVAAAFYNFAPGLVAKSWARAVESGLDRVAARRLTMVDETLTDALGALADDGELDALARWYGEVVERLPISGRPLAAAWASTPVPDAPHLALWRHLSVLREWRGDNHIATLVYHDLVGIDAATVHEAELPDADVSRRTLGHDFFLASRGWTEEDWQASIDRLIDRGLATRTDTGHRLTDSGYDLYRAVEHQTDELSSCAWSSPEALDMITATRPYVKAVIDAGILPGT